ncbi:hypothetical protein HHK36_011052 [Tetracentron sinense]|uniref:Legume lectin domain-containing protein n=1 Tax=Tetracentron sinense TaxID=13715 RepID=A0A834Z8G8_TETSI|nr:hypothetical protein HHK36_011052 [Tetracentron sinense]
MVSFSTTLSVFCLQFLPAENNSSSMFTISGTCNSEALNLVSPMAKPFRLFWAFVFLSNLVFSQLDDFFYNTGSHGVEHNMSLYGAAEIEKNGVLCLTNVTNRLFGQAFHPYPLLFKNSTDGTAFSFSTSFVFAIVPEYPRLGGNGLAFTISATKELARALPSQYLGLFNATNTGNFSNHVFAVEFDTVQEMEFGDINDNHVGIDINSLVSNISATAAYFRNDSTKEELHLISGKPIQAWIDYDSRRNQLNVTLSLAFFF